MLTYERFILEEIENKYKNNFFYSIKSAVQYQSGKEKMSDIKAEIKAQKIFDRFDTENFKKWFNGSKITSQNFMKPDDSPGLVYHSSDDNFSKFNTPAFFGDGGTNSYSGDYFYYCVLQMKNPLEMRRSVLGKEQWMKKVGEILKDASRFESRMDFADKYEDGYGFFKLLEGDKMFDPYRWDLVYKYINENGYDGMIYRESDQIISWYFDGFLVMKPEQIKIVFKQSKSDD